jgi:hypothetical protein
MMSFQVMLRNRPEGFWTLAAIVALLLFYFPLVNGIVAGVIGGWFDTEPKKAAGHGLVTAMVLLALQWAIQLYGAVWAPFAPFDALTRAAFCSVPLFFTAVLVTFIRTAHRSPAV